MSPTLPVAFDPHTTQLAILTRRATITRHYKPIKHLVDLLGIDLHIHTESVSRPLPNSRIIHWKLMFPLF
jgi:hypothetical protein